MGEVTVPLGPLMSSRTLEGWYDLQDPEGAYENDDDKPLCGRVYLRFKWNSESLLPGSMRSKQKGENDDDALADHLSPLRTHMFDMRSPTDVWANQCRERSKAEDAGGSVPGTTASSASKKGYLDDGDEEVSSSQKGDAGTADQRDRFPKAGLTSAPHAKLEPETPPSVGFKDEPVTLVQWPEQAEVDKIEVQRAEVQRRAYTPRKDLPSLPTAQVPCATLHLRRFLVRT